MQAEVLARQGQRKDLELEIKRQRMENERQNAAQEFELEQLIERIDAERAKDAQLNIEMKKQVRV